MRMVFVMDPVTSIIADEDTTFSLMREALSREHVVYHALIHHLELEQGVAMVRCRPVTLAQGGETAVTLGPWERLCVSEMGAVFVRKDPPFDHAYWWATLILERVRGVVTVINDPRGLRDANEKLYACHFPDLMPPALVSADATVIRNFVEEIGGHGVIKPVDGHGGEDVFSLRLDDANHRGLVQQATLGGRRLTMVQAYLPQVAEGDKRVLVLDGEVMGGILRVPQGGDIRSNIHVGGKVVATEVTDRERAAVRSMADRLRADGLHFVGLDFIGGWLTEVNVTSPTGIQQLTRLSGRNHEADVIRWVEARAEQAAP